MNQFLSQYPPEVQVEIIKFLTAVVAAVFVSSLVIAFVRFKYTKEHQTPTNKKKTVVEFESRFKRK